jgi:hypothetical protein
LPLPLGLLLLLVLTAMELGSVVFISKLTPRREIKQVYITLPDPQIYSSHLAFASTTKKQSQG